jgi:cytoskeletal protein RodZ
MVKVGEILRDARKNQNLTLDEVAKATKIKVEFLSIIERGEYEKLPSPAYANGFVKNYSKFLSLPVEKNLAILRREFDVRKNYDILPSGFSGTKSMSASKFRVGRSILHILIVLLFVMGFISYQYRSYVFSPNLEITSPKEGSTVTSLNIIVTGKTSPDATLFINGQDVALSKDGSFSKEITFFPGETVINVKSENRFGRVTEVTRKIFVKPNY